MLNVDQFSEINPIVLDIETQTKGTKFQYPNGTESNHPVGLDPRVSAVTSISFRTRHGLLVIDDADENVIKEVSKAYIDSIGPNFHRNVLFTWNGLFFDLPFLAVRKFGGVILLNDSMQPSIEPKYGWPEWKADVTRHDKWNYGMWGMLAHIDIAPAFREYSDRLGIRNSLKPVAESFGIEMVNVNAEEMHELTIDERITYNASDTKGTLALVEIYLDNKGIIT